MANGSGKKQVVIPKKFVGANGVLKDAADDSTIDGWILEQTQKDNTLHTTKLPIQAYETGEGTGTWEVNWAIKEVGEEDAKGKWFRGSGIRGEDTAWTLAMKDAIAQVGARGIGNIKIYSGTGDRAGFVSWAYQGESVDADQSWDLRELDDGRIIMWDRESGEKKPMIEAPTTTIPQGATPILGPDEKPSTIQNPDGSVTKFYSVTNARGQTSIEAVKEWPRIDETADISLTGGGRLIPLGQGRYTYEPDPAAEFTFDAVEGAGDIITIPGGQLIRTSKNQYQFVRDTMEAGVKVDPAYPNRKFLQQPDGSWSELSPRVDPGIVTRGGRDFLQQYTGALSELAPRFDPGIQDVDGMSLLQQRSGAISQLAKPDLDQVITQALVDGEYDKAFAFQDFRDRPTASEAFQTALQFARSPADQVLISSIARGETAVQPPPPGQIQRVGPQPDFLVQAYQDFQRRTQAGRAPTPEEAAQCIARAEAGATPAKDLEIETLQARLERIQQDTANAQAAHDAKMEQNNRSWQQLFDQKNTVNQINVAAAQAKANGGTGTTTATPTTGTPGNGGVETVQGDPKWVTDFYGNKVTQEEYDSDYTYTIPGEAGKFTKEQVDAHIANLNRGTGADGTPTIDGTPTATNREIVPATLSKSLRREAQDEGFLPLDPTPRPIAREEPGFLPRFGRPNQPAVPKPTEVIPKSSLEAQRAAADKRAEASRLANIYEDKGGTKPRPTPLSPEKAAQRTARKEADLSSFLLSPRAGGGTVGNKELTVVGEDGPEIAMFPTGTHILPLGKATKQDIRAAQATGRAYQTGGIVFGELPLGLRQLQAGRPITPSRGYLSRAAGLTLPSAQALQNLTPESLEVYGDLAAQAGIPAGAFGQELRTTLPMGRRLPTSTMLPISRRGVR